MDLLSALHKLLGGAQPVHHPQQAPAQLRVQPQQSPANLGVPGPVGMPQSGFGMQVQNVGGMPPQLQSSYSSGYGMHPQQQYDQQQEQVGVPQYNLNALANPNMRAKLPALNFQPLPYLNKL